jgi:hypothetical protein
MNMDIPTTVADLKGMIERQVQESLHVDYKASKALALPARHEVSKDVSAFANSDGGLLVYRVLEQAHLPVDLDDGIANSTVSREAIEQMIVANVAPRIDGVEIRQIARDELSSYYSVSIPKSHRAPHQDRHTNKYYKRHNFISVPMEAYELADLRARSRLAAPLVAFDVETRHGVLFLFRISNKGELPAERVLFEFTPPLTWERAGDQPAIIRDGIEHLPPGREYVVFYHPIPETLATGSAVCTEFSVTVSYYHPLTKSRLSDTYPINLRDFLGTWPPYSPLEDLSKKVEEGLKEIAGQLKSTNERLDCLTAGVTATGLQLSVSTLRALNQLRLGLDPISKTTPQGREGPYFQEVLGVPVDVGWKIARHFWRSTSVKGLLDVPGITSDVVEKLRLYFLVDTDDETAV